jgi:hypothetical protein
MRLALIAGALAGLTIYRFVLRVRARAVLRNATPSTDAGPDVDVHPPSSRLHDITSAVDRAAGLCPFETACLERALTIRTLLWWAGESGHVVVGVRRPGDLLEAHAWVEVDRHAVDGARIRFRKLAQLR